MSRINAIWPALLEETEFKATRSRGPGGQHVNKVNTRIELRFNIRKSAVLNEEEKEILLCTLKSRLSCSGILIIVSQSGRSQTQNKKLAMDRFIRLLNKGLKRPKQRKATRCTLQSIAKRRKSKKLQSQKKNLRRRISSSEE